MSSARDRESPARSLERHLEREAPGRLPHGTRLAVTINDVDMAGEFRPVAGSSATRDLRIIKDAYPPRVDLDFRLLRADGTRRARGAPRAARRGFL